MSGPAAPRVPQQVMDDNGDPVANAKIYTYEAGTVVALATYSDSALSSANANPIVADAGGWFTAYLLPQAYKLVYKTSADVELRTTDNVVPPSVSGGTNVDVTGTAGEALSTDDCVYVSDGSGSKTAGRWYKADADLDYAALTPVIGFAVAAIASGDSGLIRCGGSMTSLSGLTAGSTYFVSGTPGSITATEPGTSRRVGQALSTTSLALQIEPHAYHSIHGVFQARMTLTSNTPVTTADVTGATTLYLTPLDGRGDQVAIYDGTRWILITLAELSLTLTSLTASKPYDIFLDYNAGTPQLVAVVWTDDTTRATALALQDNVYVRTSNADHRYLGYIYISSAQRGEDTYTKRHVKNFYNRVARPMRRNEDTDQWTYAAAAWQQANAAGANQLDFLVDIDDEEVFARVIANSDHTSKNERFVGIGLDSTSVVAANSLRSILEIAANSAIQQIAEYRDFPGVGRHYLSWLEYSHASGTGTWLGDDSVEGIAGVLQSGIHGSVLG